ncbi:MAG: tetratricopeptide repeat protein [Gemmataceae bacterium]
MTASRIEQFLAMIADDPQDHEMRYFLAMEYANSGNDQEAAKWFQEAINIKPDYPPAYHMGGRALTRLGEIAEAQTMLQKGIQVAQSVGDHHAAGEMTEFLETID